MAGLFIQGQQPSLLSARLAHRDSMQTGMNKHLLHQQVIAQLRTSLENAERALRTAHEAATHEENVAENKYDTLGLEAGYLALGQARRVEEIRAALAAWINLPVIEYDDENGIRLGILVHIKNQRGDRQRVLIGPDGAGLKLPDAKGEITLITAQSPLGQRLLGLAEGEHVSLGQLRWEVLSAY